ncbi:MAG: hypothetical protein RRY62_15745, partial [Chryseobacterium sp.]
TINASTLFFCISSRSAATFSFEVIFLSILKMESYELMLILRLKTVQILNGFVGCGKLGEGS